MAISRSPSATSLVMQSPKPAPGLRGFIESFFSQPDTSHAGGSQLTQSENESQVHEASQPPDSHVLDVSLSTPSEASQEVMAGELLSEPPHAKPVFIARDFAYRPPPKLLPFTVDEEWVVKSNLPSNPVPGTRERFVEEWEQTHSHLYRLRGNRADPPNAIPKTWGGRSKSEDERLMRQAKHQVEQRARDFERVKESATALGFTPTEPNLGAPPPVLSQEDIDRAGELRAEIYVRQREAEVLAAGYPPLIRTPPNSPPAMARRRDIVPPPRRISERHSKRKLDTSDNEHEDHKPETPTVRVRKRQHRQQTTETDDKHPGSPAPQRYSLRKRHTDEPTSHDAKPSPRRKRKATATDR